MSSSPLTEVIGVCDFSKIRAISKNIEKLLPERKQGAIYLPGEVEGSIIQRVMRGAVSAWCGHPENSQVSHRGVGFTRHLRLCTSSESEGKALG